MRIAFGSDEQTYLTDAVVAKEIPEAWFCAEPEPSEAENVAKVKRLDQARAD